ncbi:unnamed protein product [Bemisia tabaci]|uniref:palmitoyl-CoA hydrolase n=1 Tax=Bemisia tabaci TaxID=7038 RepID=A0A9P0A1F4_BEMTA|nr:unnamed protein product [Bemisia tabaci]
MSQCFIALIWIFGTPFIFINCKCICKLPTPVFLMHGLASDNSTLDYLVSKILERYPGTPIHNSNAYSNSFSYVPLSSQIEGHLGEEFLKFNHQYPNGFHLICYSQGGLLCKGLVQIYHNHSVKNFINISPPLAGYYGTLLFNLTVPEEKLVEILYNPKTQNSDSTSNQYKNPKYLDLYLKYNVFLPYINNEIRTAKSDSYKRGFSRCKNIITIGGPHDGVISPWQSSHFGFVDAYGNVIELKDTEAYKNDTYGLKTMDEEGRLINHVRSGINHTSWVNDDGVIYDFILPYLN